jgi:hypothetical protein
MPGINDAGIKKAWSVGVLERKMEFETQVALFFHHSITPLLLSSDADGKD